MVRRVAVLAVAVALAAALVCCGQAGDGSGPRVRLPAAFPADVPLPERALLSAARDLGSKGITLVFETGEPVAAVQQRLRARLEAEGWVPLSEVAVDGAVFVSYRKGARSVALGVSGTGGVTVVGLAYLKPAPERGGDQG